MPKRVQLSRAKGWRLQAVAPGAVKVDRSTRWGNPFVVRQSGPRFIRHRWSVERDGETLMDGLTQDEALGFAVMRFAVECAAGWDLTPLRGHDLACWCKPGSACHGDVLLDMANSGV